MHNAKKMEISDGHLVVVVDGRHGVGRSGEKKLLATLSPDKVKLTELAGEKIEAVLTRAPGNNAPIGGLKVTAETGWFAARPSGTESVYKIYAESFQGPDHLRRLLAEAQQIVGDALGPAKAPQRGKVRPPSALSEGTP